MISSNKYPSTFWSWNIQLQKNLDFSPVLVLPGWIHQNIFKIISQIDKFLFFRVRFVSDTFRNTIEENSKAWRTTPSGRPKTMSWETLKFPKMVTREIQLSISNFCKKIELHQFVNLISISSESYHSIQKRPSRILKM